MQVQYIILLFATICVLCSVEGVFSAEPKEFGVYVDESTGIRRYARLQIYGDYAKLKLIIRSVRKDYKPGESIVIKFFVRNDSDSEVHIYGYGSMRDFAHLWKLFHSNYDESAKSPKWETEFQERTKEERKDKYYQNLWGREGGYRYIKLQPNQEYELDSARLNDYFDLTKPDTYELTCFLATFIYGQCYDPPLQSNTLTFRVLEDGEKAENIEEGPNPPKGKEVFKQPKPPKSVFYVYEDDDPGNPWMRTDNGRSIAKPRKIIDISPEMYYHGKPLAE